MPYPVFTAGQGLTAAQLAAMQPAFVRKASNESRTSTTTLQPDAELTVTLLPGRFYRICGLIIYSADVNTDMQLRADMPTNGWWEFSAQSPAASITAATTVTVDLTLRGNGTAFTVGGSNAAGSNAARFTIQYQGVGYSGDGGAMRWTWAPGANTTVAAIMRSGSHIHAEIVS